MQYFVSSAYKVVSGYLYNEFREIINENDESEPCLNMVNFNMGFTSY